MLIRIIITLLIKIFRSRSVQAKIINSMIKKMSTKSNMRRKMPMRMMT